MEVFPPPPGGGLLPEYFLHRLSVPENQVFLPEYDLLFCPKMAIKNYMGVGWGGEGELQPL